MAELSVSVEVDAPAERTWAAVTDWAAQGAWIPLTRVQVAAGSAGDRIGGRLEAFTGVGPVGFLDTMEITAWAPPHRCEVRHTGRVVRGCGAFEVEPLGEDRSRFTWTEWLQLPFGPFGASAWLLAAPLAERSVRLALSRFARSLSAG